MRCTEVRAAPLHWRGLSPLIPPSLPSLPQPPHHKVIGLLLGTSALTGSDISDILPAMRNRPVADLFPPGLGHGPGPAVQAKKGALKADKSGCGGDSSGFRGRQKWVQAVTVVAAGGRPGPCSTGEAGSAQGGRQEWLRVCLGEVIDANVAQARLMVKAKQGTLQPSRIGQGVQGCPVWLQPKAGVRVWGVQGWVHPRAWGHGLGCQAGTEAWGWGLTCKGR